jgi:peptide-methionine (S)-S-oxide reductase
VAFRTFIKRIVAPLLLLAGIGWIWAGLAAEPPVSIVAPAVDNPKQAGPLQTAVLAGGCFWGVQGVFEHVRGVHKVLAGYSGGDQATAAYGTVSSGHSGHAESVQVVFDPAELTYGQVLQVYFSVAHDPTQLNRQGPDTGTQYRSAIFYADDTQKRIAQSYIAQLDKSGAFGRTIVTQLDALKGFYPAEGYHQDFLLRNPNNPYIAINDLPKIRNLKLLLPDYYRDAPVRTADSR